MAKGNGNISVAIIKNIAGKVLIILRLKPEVGNDDSRLTWVFPGGKQEPDETYKEAVVRETKDETGYNIKVIKKISERDHPQINVHIRYYACEMADFKVKPIHDVHEVEKLKWVDPKELKEYLTTDLDPKVAKYLKIKWPKTPK